MLIQNEHREQVDTFPYLGSLITEDGECTTKFRTSVKQSSGDRDIAAENMEKSQHTDFNEDATNESASVAIGVRAIFGGGWIDFARKI